MDTTKIAFAGTALGLMLVAQVAAAQSFQMKEEAGVRWTCAGIGEDERAAFAKLEGQSNLKLVFAEGPQGAYVADVDVALADAAGKRIPLRFTAGAPICLLQAPAGRYRVEATYGNTKKSGVVAVSKEPGRPATAVLHFPASR